ncbi:MAG: cupin domain-containing protein [Sulfuritalea sp.]|nr:cupin domain-containing protein [Sulfuritalea sp.]
MSTDSTPPASDFPDESSGDDGRAEREINRLILEGLAPMEVPPAHRASLRGRLMARVGESQRRHAGLVTVRAGDGAWRNIKAGVRAKTLREGPAGASVLIELAPGAALPVHRHRHLEEGIVLQGGLQLGDLELGPGDYHVSPAGSRHGRISSRQGGIAYLRGTSLGHAAAVLAELVGGLVPGDGPALHTVLAGDGVWETVADGAEQKLLWRDGNFVSRFIRLAPGTRLPPHAHDGEEECIMLAGEAFFGDILVRAGEFHLAPHGSVHLETFSETGGMAFLRSGNYLPAPAA